jgi:hypothetical protein
MMSLDNDEVFADFTPEPTSGPGPFESVMTTMGQLMDEYDNRIEELENDVASLIATVAGFVKVSSDAPVMDWDDNDAPPTVSPDWD